MGNFENLILESANHVFYAGLAEPEGSLTNWPSQFKVEPAEASLGNVALITDTKNDHRFEIVSPDPTFFEELSQFALGKIEGTVNLEQFHGCDGGHYLLTLVKVDGSLISGATSEEFFKLIKNTENERAKIGEAKLTLADTSDWNRKYEDYALLRRDAPVYYDLDLESWIITRYEDVLELARDPRVDLNGVLPAKIKSLPEDVATALKPITDFLQTWMIYNQDPTHDELKKPMSKMFSSQNLQEMEDRIKYLSDGLISNIKANYPDGEFDVVREYAHPLPAMILGEMLGVPLDRITQFLSWSDQLASFMQNFVVSPLPDVALSAATVATIEEMKVFFEKSVQTRTQENTGDILHDVVSHSTLSVETMRNQCIHMMFGGHKVPEFLLGNLLVTVFKNDGLYERLANDRSLIDGVVQEAIRYESPIQFITRTANEDIALHGQTLKTGDNIMLVIASANRDPSIFMNPDTFDVTRNSRRHLGFGAGSHYCIGSSLVNLELRIMVNSLLDAFPNLKPKNPDMPIWSSNPTFHGVRELPVFS